jgi:hypothetical protein
LCEPEVRNNATNNTSIIKAGTPRRISRPDYLLYGGAAATRNGLYDLDRFASTGVLDKVPDVDVAIGADVGALVLVVVRLSRWVRGCARLLCAAHGASTS